MAAVNSVSGIRLPLAGFPPPRGAVLMCSAAMGAEGSVTLQLREADPGSTDVPPGALGLGSVLARLHEDAALAIGYPDPDMLADMLGTLHAAGSGDSETEGSASFELLEACSDQDLPGALLAGTRSPGVPEQSSSTESSIQGATLSADPTRLQAVAKKPRPKAVSPTRQGPQQCQVCSKVFGNASALAKHKLTHSDERKYVCTMCAKAFKRQDHLNGHMLTHRNKKPYECKADGCGKSYCDARSLRRHTENHHSGSGGGSGSQGQSASATLSPATASASGDASSPHGATCIQYAPSTPTSGGSSKSSGSSSKTGSPQSTTAGATSPKTTGETDDFGAGNDGLTRQQLELISQIMQQTKQQAAAGGTTNTGGSGGQRSGGNKANKPPRTWNMQTQLQQNANKSSATSSTQSAATQGAAGATAPGAPKPEQKPVECNLCHRKFKNIPALNGHMRLHGGYFKKDSENKKCEKKEPTGPPLQTASVSVRALIEEKIINKRSHLHYAGAQGGIQTSHSSQTAPTVVTVTTSPTTDANGVTKASFAVPATPPVSTISVRRNSESDPFVSPKLPQQDGGSAGNKDATLIELLKRGTKVAVKRAVSDPGQGVTGSLSSPTGPCQVQLSLGGPGGDVFTLAYTTASDSGTTTSTGFYAQDEVYHVQDTAMLLQAVDSIQLLHDASAAEQLEDIASLEDYASVTACLQDSSSSSPFASDGAVSGAVGGTQGRTSGGYSSGPVNQDLQAVLDSPLPDSLAEFSAYHSHSPGGGKDVLGFQKEYVMYTNSPHSAITAPSPLPSPLRYHDSPGLGYPTPPASHETQNSNSPGTQTFTLDDRQTHSPLSAAAYFNSTLNSQSTDSPNNNYGLDDARQTNSPLSAVFFNSAPNNGTGSSFIDDARQTSSPLSAAFFTTTMSSAEEVEEALETVLPGENIHDELDIYPQSPTIQLPYLPSLLQSQMMPNSEDPLLSSSPKDFGSRKKFDFGNYPLIYTNDKRKVDVVSTPAPLKISIESIKIEPSDVFLSPNSISASPNRNSRKRLRCESATPIKCDFKSRLRHNYGHFTPPPMLNPSRSGPGLYHHVSGGEYVNGTNDVVQNAGPARVNTGPNFQAAIPECNTGSNKEDREPTYEHLLWDPGIIHKSSQKEVRRYLDFATCAAMPAGGYTQEQALEVLLACGGDLQQASLRLLLQGPAPIVKQECGGAAHAERWAPDEIETFLRGLGKHDKDFYLIAKEIKSKTSQQCVAFYYLWKKLCGDYKSLYLGRTEHTGVQDEAPQAAPELRAHACEVADCSASFSSRAALHGHTRIHCIRGVTASPPVQNNTGVTVDPAEEYPCKICGKIFTKVKSRSAHMKSHRPVDPEASKKGPLYGMQGLLQGPQRTHSPLEKAFFKFRVTSLQY